MTNDTSTLNGALQELGELMANNLTEQGVASTYDEGLTTLANKILDIQGGGTTQTLTLTADKSVLSYYDSDTTTLTATLTGGNVTNKTIEFFNGSTSMGTAQTDSNGVATKTYTSTGVGEVLLKAEGDNGTLVSEILTLKDVYYARDELSFTRTSSIPNNILCDETTSLTLPSSFELSFDIETTGASSGNEHRFFLMPRSLFVSGSQPKYGIFLQQAYSNKGTLGQRNNGSTQAIGSDFTGFNPNTSYSVRIIRNNNTLTLYFGESITKSGSVSWLNNYTDYCFGFQCWANGTMTVNNLQLKEL